MKKAIAIQFTWIFVLLIGGLLFAFFMNVVSTQKKVAEDKSSVSLKNDLGNLLKTAQAGTDSFNSHQFYDAELTFECEEPDTSSFSIGKKQIKESLSTTVLFSQEKLKDKTLYTWALDWDIPYYAATFLYLSNKRTKYWFYKGDTPECQDFITDLYEELPEGLDKEYISAISDITDKGHAGVIIVQHDSCQLPKATSVENPYSAIGQILKDPREPYIITIKPQNSDSGEINFIKPHSVNKAIQEGDSPYYRKEMMLGALFAPQKDLYDCTIQKAFKRAAIVTRLNYERVKFLNDNILPSKNWCTNLYGVAVQDVFSRTDFPLCGNLRVFENFVDELNGETMGPDESWEDNYQPAGDPCSGNALERLDNNYNRLIRATRDIIYQGSCPYIY